MERAITIDGREIRLRSSAGIPRLYRLKFRRDMMQDIKIIANAMEKNKENAQNGVSELPVEALTLFENVAYLMAKHADQHNVPDSVDEWLDSFETFSIYTVFPVIQELWAANLETLNTPVKK